MSTRESGSAVIEAVVVGSVVFLMLMAAISASISVVVRGAEAQEAARAGAIHAARHDDVESARRTASLLYPGIDVTARRSGAAIETLAVVLLDLPHPTGPTRVSVRGQAEMPLAPFRSDRG